MQYDQYGHEELRLQSEILMSLFRRLCLFCLPLLTLMFAYGRAFGQSDPDEIGQVLGEEILAPGVALHQIKSYILSRAAPPPAATNAQQWTEEAKRLRQHLLHDVVFHGWPDEWVNSQPKFEDMGVIETGQGYRLRKLRYEIVPGFQSVAILYEPEKPLGKLPAILNVNGHVGPLGKAIEYKQKRCINFAKHGILALNLEWFFFGELRQEGNQHWYGAHLDLVGANALGIFLLEMRRGLDYLYNHPSVDPNRVGVTGLSGGGWQTILLGSLDERVKVAVPVAGYSSMATKVEARKYGDLGDIEQNGTDLLAGLDYTHLTAMMAPRPTLLIYDAEDDCCFRAPLVKPLVYDSVKPFFKLYGREDVFQWYENRDPGTHTISSTIGSTPIGFSAGSSACLLSKKRFQWARRSRGTMSSSSDSQKTISLFWDWRGNSARKLHAGRFRSIPPPNPVGQMRKERNCVPWSATNPCNLRACGPWPTRNTGGSRLYPICLKWTTDYASVGPGSRESLHRRRRQSLSCSMIRVGRPRPHTLRTA